jgi:hypothetical protein
VHIIVETGSGNLWSITPVEYIYILNALFAILRTFIVVTEFIYSRYKFVVAKLINLVITIHIASKNKIVPVLN